MAYRFTPIINDLNVKALVSYFIRNNSSSENPIFIDRNKYEEIINTYKLPSTSEQINNLLKWFGRQSDNSLDTVDGYTKNLPALIGAKNQLQVINLLDQLLKDDYIEMENPSMDLRERPSFNGFCGYLTSKGISKLEELDRSNTIITFNTPVLSVEKFLKDETKNLEVKGSLQLDLNRLLKGEGKKVNDINVALSGVLKSITSFLNTSGGNILIGAVETDKFKLDEINKIEYKLFSNYYLIGVLVENNNLDNYQLTFRNLTSSHISKEVSGLVDIYFNEFEGFTLCNVAVNKVNHKWYYLDRKFFVRDGNRTIELTGEDGDNYKIRNKRF
ncbi:MAG: hypothetical protein A2V93_08750 [Ignavibacteria bacterium RBG_16_34_14]|nr:MAG: hypothetical protein A2V93_08750 [Ignavibacteria bacterium RBG_16_34_14]